MNRIYYSPSRNGFFPEQQREQYETSESGWPLDAIEITQDLYKSLLEGQQDNKEIVPGAGGRPELKDIALPTTSQLISIADGEKLLRMAAASEMIAPLQDAVDLDMASETEKENLRQWKAYRVFLNRVDTSTAPDVVWPTPPHM